MDHFQQIYHSRAADYHRMIAAEDAEGQLQSLLELLGPRPGERLLDLGTGTGRVPLMLKAAGAQVVGAHAVGLERAGDMLRENAAQRARAGGSWTLVQADMRAVPLPSGWADVVTAGWAIGHLRGWHAADWQAEMGQVLAEMQRVAAPGGRLVIMETLTTGAEVPAPPTPELAEYYAWLEQRWGFWRQIIRTDYVFASVDEAVARTEFFFGLELAETIRRKGWARLPEWTGVWSKRNPASASPR
jgi:ubiquinone/menaquinone biosynthesis C-methylase UbiE